MTYSKEFMVEPGSKVHLRHVDPAFTGKLSKAEAGDKTDHYCDKLRDLQMRLYAEKKHALLIVLQGMDAAGKDGVINHVIGAMNVQGTEVSHFNEPTPEERNHDFLWRVHQRAPGKGTVGIFNRSYYEDVLVVRVHNLVPEQEWSKRYASIDDFEKLLRKQNNTRIVKFFLHISKDEQLARFKERLDEPSHNWKISESDYSERSYWDDYVKAYEEIFERTSTKHAPWYVIPSNHKWFRNLAVSQILAEVMDDMHMKLPEPTVDLEAIRRKYHIT